MLRPRRLGGCLHQTPPSRAYSFFGCAVNWQRCVDAHDCRFVVDLPEGSEAYDASLLFAFSIEFNAEADRTQIGCKPTEHSAKLASRFWPASLTSIFFFTKTPLERGQ